MNVDELREQLQSAAQPPRPLMPPLQDLQRRGRRRTRRRSVALAAGLAAVVGVVVSGTLYLGRPGVEPATPPVEPFPAQLSWYRLAYQVTGAPGQTDLSAVSRDPDGELSITCTANDAEHLQILVTSEGVQPRLVACSRRPTLPTTLGGYDAGGMPAVRHSPIRLRLVDLSYQVKEIPPAALPDPTAQLAVAVYVP